MAALSQDASPWEWKNVLHSCLSAGLQGLPRETQGPSMPSLEVNASAVVALRPIVPDINMK
jgi:hypothetical protein